MTDPSEPSAAEREKTFERELRSAERAHDRRNTGLESTNNQVLSFANAAMRAPALVSAGGVAAALGFYSANYTRLAQEPANLETFNAILFWLFLSLLLTVAAPGLAYFSQICYVSAIVKETYHWDHPYVRETKKSKRLERAGDAIRWLTILAVFASIICLCIGGAKFLYLAS